MGCTSMTKRKTPKADYTKQPAVARIVAMLKRRRGATTAAMAAAMDYQSHTVRAVVSRLRSRAGLTIVRTADPKRGHVYRLGK
jgi:predicted ArsR family transcriptional regulator